MNRRALIKFKQLHPLQQKALVFEVYLLLIVDSISVADVYCEAIGCLVLSYNC